MHNQIQFKLATVLLQFTEQCVFAVVYKLLQTDGASLRWIFLFEKTLYVIHDLKCSVVALVPINLKNS